MKIREVSMLPAVIAALINFISQFVVTLTDTQQSVLNAVVVAVAGAITAWSVSAEKGLAALATVAQALIALSLGFGAHVTVAGQAAIMTLVTVTIGFIVRQLVVAPVAATAVRVATAPAAVIPNQAGGRAG